MERKTPTRDQLLACFAVVLLLGGFLLAVLLGDRGDSSSAVTPTTVDRISDPTHYIPREQLVDYRGHLLHCVLLDASFEGSRVCDFQRFYWEHPDLAHK